MQLLMFRRLAALVALATVATGLTACGDDQTLRASVAVVSDTLTAYNVDIADLSFPTGLSTVARTVVPISGGAADFDVAFRILPDLSVDVIPIRQVVSPLGQTPMIGILKSTETYEGVLRAPEVNFRADTTTNVLVGETFMLQVFRNTGLTICYYMYPPRVYAKIVIDSVNVGNGAVYLRQTVNPNCGYRSLVPGVPND